MIRLLDSNSADKLNMEKRCPRCQETKSVSDFGKASKRPDGLQPWCKKCKRDYENTTYAKDAEFRSSRLTLKAARVALNRERIFGYLQEHPCVDCGNADILVLEFDHLDGKEYNVSGMLHHAWDRIAAEIAKCEVRCANCHRRVTHKRASSHRWLYAATR